MTHKELKLWDEYGKEFRKNTERQAQLIRDDYARELDSWHKLPFYKKWWDGKPFNPHQIIFSIKFLTPTWEGFLDWQIEEKSTSPK